MEKRLWTPWIDGLMGLTGIDMKVEQRLSLRVSFLH